jgi:hypothetical protein
MVVPSDRFQFDLAERLGMTVGEMRQRMSAGELLWWLAKMSVDAGR